MKTLKAATQEILAALKKTMLTASSTVENINTKVVAVADAESPPGDITDHAVFLTGRTKMGWPGEEDYLQRQILSERELLSYLGNIFENNCVIFPESLVIEPVYCLNNTEEELRQQHTTIE